MCIFCLLLRLISRESPDEEWNALEPTEEGRGRGSLRQSERGPNLWSLWLFLYQDSGIMFSCFPKPKKKSDCIRQFVHDKYLNVRELKRGEEKDGRKETRKGWCTHSFHNFKCCCTLSSISLLWENTWGNELQLKGLFSLWIQRCQSVGTGSAWWAIAVPVRANRRQSRMITGRGGTTYGS